MTCPAGAEATTTIQATIDGRQVRVPLGTTILEAARARRVDAHTDTLHQPQMAEKRSELSVMLDKGVGQFVLPLVLVLVPWVGTERFGARRWLDFGAFSLQPSELALVAVLLITVPDGVMTAHALCEIMPSRAIPASSAMWCGSVRKVLACMVAPKRR